MAIDEYNRYISAHQVQTTMASYFCPACRQPLILKRGEHKVAHFAHRDLSVCQHTFSEGESSTHLTGKLALYQLLKGQGTIQLEPVLAAIDQRPDLLWQHPQSGMIAIEYQCSPISAKRLAERNQGYRSQGISVYWILGPKYYHKNLRPQTIQRFIQAGVLYFYLPSDNYLRCQSNWLKADFQRLKYCEKKVSRLENLSFTVPITDLKANYQRQKLQQLMLQKRVDSALIDYLYQQHRRLDQVPDWILLGTTFGLKVPNWHFRLVIWLLLAPFQDQTVLTITSLVKRLEPYFILTPEQVFLSVKEVLLDLQKGGHIGLADGEIQVFHLPVWRD
ncbi:competence protein CoiA [Convivina praedatoris]|nr:competence protein CoiA family protein [Convivina sp. LMG 32447]